MPDNLPDELKRKNQPSQRVLINLWGCALAVIMLGAGMTIGVAGAIFLAPTYLGYDATATALGDYEMALVSTEVDLNQQGRDLDNRATDLFRESAATQGALSNEEILLDQTATQSRQNVNATQTAIANLSAQQQTQVAIDATDSARNFQLTQEGFSATPRESAAQVVAATPTPTRTATATLPPTNTPLPPPSDTPTPTVTPVTYGFSEGITSDTWAEITGWVAQDSAARANRDGAWLLTDVTYAPPYTLDMDFSPALTSRSAYWLLFAVDADGGYAVRLDAVGLTVETVQLYRIERAMLGEMSPAPDSVTLLRSASVSQVLSERNSVRVQVTGDRLQVDLRGATVLTASIAAPFEGAVGAQASSGARLHSLTVQPN